MTSPLTEQQLAAITLAVATTFDEHESTENRRARWENAAWMAGRTVDRNALAVYMAVADAEQRAVADRWAQTVAASDTEVRRLRTRMESATEFRLLPAPPAYTPLIVRRDPAYDGTAWAVLHDPGDSSVRRAWTAEGWEMAWASSHEEIYCWPDADSALAQARRAQGEDDMEPDVDGAGRTAESYRDRPPAASV
ncbi:hypothetical protein ACJWDR_29045 [Streptomyces tauricus]|uniref:hypothetical protein n=1 Tax=Streptomyces tauricus TaxID=68274 RepID=UPI00387F308E